MKSEIKFFIAFFALILFFTSCQEEEVEITEPIEDEALVAESNLTNLVGLVSKMDGSIDNIIDRASCLSVKLPITVYVRGIEIIIDSHEDFQVIENIYDEFENDIDSLDIYFPITVILSNHEERIIESRQALDALISGCQPENEEDDDIECIDFKFPISFSIYNPNFQVTDVVTIQTDRQLHHFMSRVRNAEVIARLNFPVTMVYANGTETIVNSNRALENTIANAKESCDEDDDNDYNDDDFTKERLETYLKSCPWIVYEFERNNDNLRELYNQYTVKFNENNVVNVITSSGTQIYDGTWSTRVTSAGVLVKLEFGNLLHFTLEWLVYDIGPDSIKFYQQGGNKILLARNCEVDVDTRKRELLRNLFECPWEISSLVIDGVENSQQYSGINLSFHIDNIIKTSVNGDTLEEARYDIFEGASGLSIKTTLNGIEILKRDWLITFMRDGLIHLQSDNNQMVLKRICSIYNEPNPVLY